MADSFHKKLDNFLYYYKKTLIAGCLAAVLLFSGICSYGKGEAEPVLYGVLLNHNVSEDTAAQVCQKGLLALGKNPDKEKIMLETGLTIDVENPEANSMSGILEKMTSQIFSHELDFLIGPEAVMEYYAELGGLYELDETGSYGVDISRTALGSEEETIMFCILKNSEHKDEALLFLESLQEES